MLNVFVEGVQAGGKEEEGEGSQGGAHLRVQDCPQDRVRRWEGENQEKKEREKREKKREKREIKTG